MFGESWYFNQNSLVLGLLFNQPTFFDKTSNQWNVIKPSIDLKLSQFHVTLIPVIVFFSPQVRAWDAITNDSEKGKNYKKRNILCLYSPRQFINGVVYHISPRFFCLKVHAFFISNTFISIAGLKLAKK